MEEVEKALYELGVPCKTRHNEVAPHQFEMAPIFVEANLAADQNQMVMEVLQKKASEFGLHVLLHEKPFAEVNGNGKHLNWSMATKSGINLLEPGQEPHANLRFLYVLVAILDGVHRHGGVLRASIASAGNDHRLGANEAPPAIISVFTGSHLNQILTKLENSEELTSQALEEINLGLEELPNVAKDNTDRNRTSPFAFTGNKFEFRAVGGAQSISLPTTLLNAAVAQALNQLNEEIAALGPCDDKAILKVLSEHIAKSKAIRFEGNNYAKEWQDEAARRGLPHFPNTPTALDCWEWPQTIELLTSLGIMNEDEIKARLNIKREGYAKTIDIEAFTLLRLVDTHVAPSALRYQLTVAKAYDETEDILGESCLAEQKGLLTKLSQTLNQLLKAKSDLEIVLGEARSNHDPKIASSVYGEKVLPTMNYLRSFADELEKMVDSREWDLPTYHELLFLM
jgi:glutamine synthetase